MKKTMKRGLMMAAVAIMVALGLNASAQQMDGVQLEQGPMGKALQIQAGRQTYLAKDGKYVVMSEFSGMLMDKQKVACYDWDQQKVGEMEIGKEEAGYCLLAGAKDGEVRLLRFRSNDNGCRVFLDKRGLPSLGSRGESTLMEAEASKGDFCWMRTGKSNNGQLVAVSMSVARKGIGVTTKVLLYSSDFEEQYWSMTLEDVAPTKLLVTDSGEVAFAMLADESGKTSRCVVLDGETVETHRFVMETDQAIYESGLMGYQGGNFVVYLATRNPKQHFNATFDRVTFYGIDTKNNMVHVSTHDITDEEYAMLVNKKVKTEKKKNIPFGNITQTLHDESGAYLVLESAWTVVQNGMPTDYNRQGMVVIKTDTLGRVEWSYSKRMCAYIATSYQLMLGYEWVPTPQGIMLAAPVLTKNYKLPAEKEYGKFRPTASDAVLNVVHLSRDGKELVQTGLPIGKTGLVSSPKLLDDGSYLLMLRGRTKGCFAYFKLQ